MNNITDIAFEQIGGNYHWSRYGEFKVIIDITTGYINATRLCGMALGKGGKPKQFRDWRANATTNELLDALADAAGIPAASLFTIVTDRVDDIVCGTYAHPDLIAHIACWASSAFAVKVSKIVNAHLVREYKESIRAKDQAIDRLEAKVDAQSAEINRVISRNDAQSTEIATLLAEVRAGREDNHHMSLQLDNVANDLDDAAHVNDQLVAQVEAIAIKLDVATEQRVPHAQPSK